MAPVSTRGWRSLLEGDALGAAAGERGEHPLALHLAQPARRCRSPQTGPLLLPRRRADQGARPTGTGRGPAARLDGSQAAPRRGRALSRGAVNVTPVAGLNTKNTARLCRAVFFVSFVLISSGCKNERATAVTPVTQKQPAAPVQFTDIAGTVGVRFKHTNGAGRNYYLAETMGSGCAFLDYDGDGRLDLFLVNSSRLPGCKEKGPFYPALYHQKPDGSFEDVTKQAGLAIDCYGMGVAVGDYDNDGHPDLYLTAHGGSHLFHNNGNGAFTEVTRTARVPGPAIGTSAAWFDYDRDGFLDLFVCNYCRWSPALNQTCGDSSGRYICGPKYYEGTASVLYHNN